MKTKTLLFTALVGVAAVSAQAGVHWNISVSIPLPICIGQASACCVPPPVVYSPPPFVYVPPCPPPVSVQFFPACPSQEYVWVNGGWSDRPGGNVSENGFPVRHPVQFKHRVEHIERNIYFRSLRR